MVFCLDAMVAAFFATFDDRTGPTVNYEEPEGAFEKGSDGRRVWEQYSDYVMSGNAQLDGRLIKVRSGSDAVLCMSVVIRDDEKYRRNALLFSIGVMFPGEFMAAVSWACSSALGRMARALRSMELESSALSREGSEEYLSLIIPDALYLLRSVASAAVDEEDAYESPSPSSFGPTPPSTPLSPAPPHRKLPAFMENDPNVFSLRRPFIRPQQRSRSAPSREQVADPVCQWHVPVLLAKPEDLSRLNSTPKPGTASNTPDYVHGDDQWDMGIAKVFPYLDGIRNARQIARAANVDVDLVCKSLRVLSHYNCLALIDTFQYSNIYRVTDVVRDLVLVPEALGSCADFVLNSSQEDADEELIVAASADYSKSFLEKKILSKSFSATSFSMGSSSKTYSKRRRESIATSVLRLYCGFRDGRSVKDVFLAVGETHPDIINRIDDRAFIAFGALHGILRRVHRYPIATLNFPLYPQLGQPIKCIEEENDDDDVNGRQRRHRRRSRSEGTAAENDLLLEEYDDAAACFQATTTTKRLPIEIKVGEKGQQRDGTSCSTHKKRATTPEDVMQLARILAFMDGEHCMDEICTDLELAPKHIEEILRNQRYNIIDVFR